MTTEAQQGRLDDGLTVLRRVRDYEVLQEENGIRRPSSQAFIQGGPDGNVSVYLASETTPERITRDYGGYLRHRGGNRSNQKPRAGRGERIHRRRPRTLQHHGPQDEIEKQSNSAKLALGEGIRACIDQAKIQVD